VIPSRGAPPDRPARPHFAPFSAYSRCDCRASHVWRGAFLVAEMITELGGQTALQDCLDQRRHESARTGQLQPVLVDPSQQHVQPLLINQLASIDRTSPTSLR
jgi:hypothetical protein